MSFSTAPISSAPASSNSRISLIRKNVRHDTILPPCCNSQNVASAAPDAPITRAEAAVALAAHFGDRLTRDQAIRHAIDRGWMRVDHRNWFHPDLPFFWTDFREEKLPARPVKRSEFALWLERGARL